MSAAAQDTFKHGDTSTANAASTFPQQSVAVQAAPVATEVHRSEVQHLSSAGADPSARLLAAPHVRPGAADTPQQSWVELSSVEAANRETINRASSAPVGDVHGTGAATKTAAPLEAADAVVLDEVSGSAASAREESTELAERHRPPTEDASGSPANTARPAADFPGQAARAAVSNREGDPPLTSSQPEAAAEVPAPATVTAGTGLAFQGEADGPGRPTPQQPQASAELHSLAGAGAASTREEAAGARLEAAAARLQPQPPPAASVGLLSLAGEGPASTREEATGARPEAAAARLQPRPLPAAACESERGGVPGESPGDRAAFLESLQRHWEREAREDFVQNRCAHPGSASGPSVIQICYFSAALVTLWAPTPPMLLARVT